MGINLEEAIQSWLDEKKLTTTDDQYNYLYESILEMHYNSGPFFSFADVAEKLEYLRKDIKI